MLVPPDSRLTAAVLAALGLGVAGCDGCDAPPHEPPPTPQPEVHPCLTPRAPRWPEGRVHACLSPPYHPPPPPPVGVDERPALPPPPRDVLLEQLAEDGILPEDVVERLRGDHHPPDPEEAER